MGENVLVLADGEAMLIFNRHLFNPGNDWTNHEQLLLSAGNLNYSNTLHSDLHSDLVRAFPDMGQRHHFRNNMIDYLSGLSMSTFSDPG